MDAAQSTLIGVGIMAFVSVIALLVNYLATKRNLTHQTKSEFAKISIDCRTQQINELYGPLMLLLEQNRRLAGKIREGKGDPIKWRLLDNLDAVLANQADKAIADEIVKIDVNIEALIVSKAGFIRSPGPPESFDLFLGHCKILNLAMQGSQRPKVAEFEYYPRQLNRDVQEAYTAIQNERTAILNKYIDGVNK